MSKPCLLVESVGNFHSGTSFWSFCFDSSYISEFCNLPAWWSVPSRTVIYFFLFSFAFVSFLSAAIFSNKSFCCVFSMQHVLSFMLFLREDVPNFVYTFTLRVWVSAWKLKTLQICDQCGLFIHSSSTEILSQKSLFCTYILFYTFIHKHLKILKCPHRTASQKLFCSKRRVAESESSSLHYRYGWNNSSHWVPLQQDITVLLGGWNKSDENNRFTKPPRFHSKIKKVREHCDSRSHHCKSSQATSSVLTTRGGGGISRPEIWISCFWIFLGQKLTKM